MTATKTKEVKRVKQEAENFIKGLYVVQEGQTSEERQTVQNQIRHATLLLFFF